ncbi:MAG: transglycosylase SLT domain-containing protein [Proteobacteria bacterium]|nr:transglycosylase SLT domain-containing protein [Pseudomonadota bacterium]MBU1686995.1 transglycosylase SLT domain-containing protein [Pseudomonadota bacterium]
MGTIAWIRITAVCLATLSVILISSRGYATIYSFVDPSGVVHFTNVPEDPKYQLMIRNQDEADSKGSLDRLISHLAPPIIPDWDEDPQTFYDPTIRLAARTYQIDPRLVKAIIKAESNFNFQAVSKRGALGLMQLMPGTADEMMISDPFDPRENIIGGTRYLRKVLGLFKGDLRLSLAAYNAGPNKVKTLGRIPDFPETISYIKRVDFYYQQFKDASSPSKRWAKNFYTPSGP